MARPRLLADGKRVFVSLVLSLLLAASVGAQHAWSCPLPVAPSPDDESRSVHTFFDSRAAGDPPSIQAERAVHDCHPPHGFVLLPPAEQRLLMAGTEKWLTLANDDFHSVTLAPPRPRPKS